MPKRKKNAYFTELCRVNTNHLVMRVEFPFKVLPRVMTKIIIYYLLKKRYGGFSTYPDNTYENKAGVKLNNMIGATHCEFKQVQRGRRRKQQCWHRQCCAV